MALFHTAHGCILLTDGTQTFAVVFDSLKVFQGCIQSVARPRFLTPCKMKIGYLLSKLNC